MSQKLKATQLPNRITLDIGGGLLRRKTLCYRFQNLTFSAMFSDSVLFHSPVEMKTTRLVFLSEKDGVNVGREGFLQN